MEGNIKELLISILEKYSLLQELEEKEESELIEVEVKSIYDGIFLTLCLEIIGNKEELLSFLNFMEEKALKETNPYELGKINELLKIRPIVETFVDYEILVTGK